MIIYKNLAETIKVFNCNINKNYLSIINNIEYQEYNVK